MHIERNQKLADRWNYGFHVLQSSISSLCWALSTNVVCHLYGCVDVFLIFHTFFLSFHFYFGELEQISIYIYFMTNELVNGTKRTWKWSVIIWIPFIVVECAQHVFALCRRLGKENKINGEHHKRFERFMMIDPRRCKLLNDDEQKRAKECSSARCAKHTQATRKRKRTSEKANERASD